MGDMMLRQTIRELSICFLLLLYYLLEVIILTVALFSWNLSYI